MKLLIQLFITIPSKLLFLISNTYSQGIFKLPNCSNSHNSAMTGNNTSTKDYITPLTSGGCSLYFTKTKCHNHTTPFHGSKAEDFLCSQGFLPVVHSCFSHEAKM